MKNPKPTLLAVHAHPDDESIGTGGILAKYAGKGVRTVVVYCTRGEEGDILNPEFTPPSPEMSMEAIRAIEVEKAIKVLNVKSVYFLGYRDSGMQGSPANRHPNSFAGADVDQAAEKLVAIIREIKPQVVVTYNEKGGYGHPDHIMAHRITVAAFHKAGDSGYESTTFKSEPWKPAKLYYTATPLERLKKRYQMAVERGETPRFNPEFMGTPEHLITTEVDVEAFIEQKFEALFCHKSQMGPNSFFRQVPREQVAEYFRHEHFICVSGCAGEKETDLFEGL